MLTQQWQECVVMIKIAFGPKISSMFNNTNPNMIFHIGKKNTVVFKPTPREGISTTKQGKGYFFTDKVEHGPQGVVIILDGNSAQAFRNCFTDYMLWAVVSLVLNLYYDVCCYLFVLL